MSLTFLKTAAAAVALGGALTMTASSTAVAADYPSRPITIVVAYPAGQAVDLLARVIGEGLSRELGQSIVVENRAGAGGVIGTQYLKRTKPDGYTIAMSSSGPLAIAPQLYKSAAYDPRADFSPIMNIAAMANVLVVRAASEYHSVGDLIAAAKARPDQINFGSPATGSTSHLTQEMLKQLAGVKMMHVPYKGTPAALSDLLGGQIDALFDASASVKPFVDKGELRALAVTSAAPIPALPDVQPLSKQGFDNFEAIGWMGMIGPAGMDPAAVKTLHAALAKVMQDPATLAKLDELGMLPIGDTPEQFGAFIASEYQKWGDVIRKADVKVE